VADVVGSRREASWLVDEALGAEGPGGAPERARRLAERRRAGEPLQYVLGHWPFRELDLLVDPRALIPRPETEWVVDVALRELDGVLAGGSPPLAVDLGTGTGAIALSIATERADHQVAVIATDRDAAALDLARANARRLAARPGTERVAFRAGSWWGALEEPLRGAVALVVSNPPYVASLEWEVLDPVVRDHEPYGALVADPGSDGTPGFAAVEAVIAGAPPWLARPAAVVVEIAPGQRDAALRCARCSGFAEAEVFDDLAGRPRALVARFG
jgi:release factor glutamine methyltransferase